MLHLKFKLFFFFSEPTLLTNFDDNDMADEDDFNDMEVVEASSDDEQVIAGPNSLTSGN